MQPTEKMERRLVTFAPLPDTDHPELALFRRLALA